MGLWSARDVQISSCFVDSQSWVAFGEDLDTGGESIARRLLPRHHGGELGLSLAELDSYQPSVPWSRPGSRHSLFEDPADRVHDSQRSLLEKRFCLGSCWLPSLSQSGRSHEIKSPSGIFPKSELCCKAGEGPLWAQAILSYLESIPVACIGYLGSDVVTMASSVVFGGTSTCYGFHYELWVTT